MKQRRRPIEEFSMSFLDVICCGFGAIILLLIITKTVAPVLLETSQINLQGQVASREQALFEIRGKITDLNRQVNDTEANLQERLFELAELQRELSNILGQFDNLSESKDDVATKNLKLASAKQSLTDEMQRLLGLDFKRSSGLVGGITVDSEYIIFVIDTSGSMQSVAWPQVVRKVSETLAIYPNVKGIQVMNDMGDYMFSRYAGRWIEDTPAIRNSIIQTLQSWAPFSNSSPVEGITAAITTYYDPDKRISIYVFGDDYTGNSIEEVVNAIDQVNLVDENGRRRVRIHAIGFPVYLDRPNARVYRFAALMRELAYRNDGTFVGLVQ